MDGIRINIMLVIVSAAGIIKLVDGYKKGIVKEVVSLITMLVLCLVAALAAYGMHSYHDGKAFNVIVAIILFCLIVAAHHLLGRVSGRGKQPGRVLPGAPGGLRGVGGGLHRPRDVLHRPGHQGLADGGLPGAGL